MITSTSNIQVKELLRLQKKSREREKEGVFIVEGPRMAEEIPRERIVKLYVSESFQAKCVKEKNDRFIQEAEVMSDTVFAHVSDTKTPQGILAVVRRMEYTAEDILGETPHVLVLENIQDPGNLGTIFRTAEAAGATGIVLSKDCVDLYNPLKGHPEFMPGGNDWVHPDHRGHYIIAKEVYKAITGEFVMNPGGITVAASDISLSGSKAKMKNGAIEKAKNGTRLSFDVHFGSLPTYEKVEVDVQLNKKKSGYLDFYLDTETIPFASVDVSGADSKNFTTQSALFDRRIKGKHKVTVQWRGQDAKLKSVTIKEKYMPYVTDNVSQVYLVNKATGMVLDCNPDSKVISAAKYDSEKKSQLFCIENLTYHILRVRNIATNLHVMNNGDKVIVGKPGDDWRVHDPKYALFLTPTDDEGYYSLGLSPEARIGLSSANSTEVVGNRSGQIEDLDKWKIVTADEMKKQ